MPESFMHPVMLLGIVSLAMLATAASAQNQPRYYAHQAVHDQYGVIAPWYDGLNGQCDWRVRIAAETLKRFPWTDTSNAIAAYPHYVFTLASGRLTRRATSRLATRETG
jgi:hypothetical protein